MFSNVTIWPTAARAGRRARGWPVRDWFDDWDAGPRGSVRRCRENGATPGPAEMRLAAQAARTGVTQRLPEFPNGSFCRHCYFRNSPNRCVIVPIRDCYFGPFGREPHRSPRPSAGIAHFNGIIGVRDCQLVAINRITMAAVHLLLVNRVVWLRYDSHDVFLRGAELV